MAKVELAWRALMSSSVSFRRRLTDASSVLMSYKLQALLELTHQQFFS
jgi:hypothetical protein